MEVRLFPNSARPGVGMKPRRESQRPLLPQHARHCPVLEAGSALGFLVYPPLEPHESFHVEYQGEGRYQFTYFLSSPRGQVGRRSSPSRCALPVGSIGMMKEEVAFMVQEPADFRARTPCAWRGRSSCPRTSARRRAASRCAAPPISRRPPGWDTVYTPVFNMIERPVAPMLVVRVETDWYPHETEFRYVLQPGEGIPGAHNCRSARCSSCRARRSPCAIAREEELAAIRRAEEEFSRDKAAAKVTTPTGLHTARTTRVRAGCEETVNRASIIK